jgi:hypothetical protein
MLKDKIIKNQIKNDSSLSGLTCQTRDPDHDNEIT